MQEELQALKRRVSRTAELQSQVKAEAAYRIPCGVREIDNRH